MQLSLCLHFPEINKLRTMNRQKRFVGTESCPPNSILVGLSLQVAFGWIMENLDMVLMSQTTYPGL